MNTTDPTTEAVEPAEDEFDVDVPDYPEVPASKPRFMTVGDHFYAQTDEGELRIRLGFKMKFIRKMRDSNKDEIGQLYEILEMSGDTGTIEKIDELDVFDAIDLVRAFFSAFEKRQKARLGELSRSSSS